jgi:hypothetical protein
MYIIEHDAKELLALRGVPVPAGCLVEAGTAIPAQLPSAGPWVVKGQITMGGRGKAGIIRKAAASEELERQVRSILGTTVRGRNVSAVRIEQQIRGPQLYEPAVDASGGAPSCPTAAVEIEAVPANEIKSEVAPLNADALAACVRLPVSLARRASPARRRAAAGADFSGFEMQLTRQPLFVYPDGSWVVATQSSSATITRCGRRTARTGQRARACIPKPRLSSRMVSITLSSTQTATLAC